MVSSLTLTPNNGLSSRQAQQTDSSISDSKNQRNQITGDDNTQTEQITDTVSISDEALQVAQNALNNSSTQYYEQFLPTHEGFSATAIAAGIIDPGLETFSAGKSFDQVAIAARASLDNNYERLEDIGKPYGHSNPQPEDHNSLFGELDRRALYAVSSNEGGLFTKDEQNIARNKLNQQQGLAMGLYNGPNDTQSKFVDPFLGDKAAQFKAGIQFLDKVSIEEKSGSFDFVLQRAGLQRGYEAFSREQGKAPEDFSTDHPLINLLLEAFDSKPENRNLNDYIEENYKDRITQALEDNKTFYGLD